VIATKEYGLSISSLLAASLSKDDEDGRPGEGDAAPDVPDGRASNQMIDR